MALVVGLPSREERANTARLNEILNDPSGLTNEDLRRGYARLQDIQSNLEGFKALAYYPSPRGGGTKVRLARVCGTKLRRITEPISYFRDPFQRWSLLRCRSAVPRAVLCNPSRHLIPPGLRALFSFFPSLERTIRVAG